MVSEETTLGGVGIQFFELLDRKDVVPGDVEGTIFDCVGQGVLREVVHELERGDDGVALQGSPEETELDGAW